MKNNSLITLILPGKPQGKQSPRKDISGKIYNPQFELMEITKRIIKYNIPKSKNFPLSKNVPITLSVNFFFPPTKKEKTKKFVELIKNDNYPYIKKPDLDNLLKLIKDCMSKIIYNDDNQVFHYREMFKYYSLNPRTEIEISW
jgi:Holliday junction resolvase RusA-like endonuclease